MPRFTTLKTSLLWCFSVLWKINCHSFANHAIRMFYLYFYLLPFVSGSDLQCTASGRPLKTANQVWIFIACDPWTPQIGEALKLGTRYYKHTSPKGQWRLHSLCPKLPHITACPHPLCLTQYLPSNEFQIVFVNRKKENKKLTDRLKMERHGWNANVVKCAFRLFTTKGASHL